MNMYRIIIVTLFFYAVPVSYSVGEEKLISDEVEIDDYQINVDDYFLTKKSKEIIKVAKCENNDKCHSKY